MCLDGEDLRRISRCEESLTCMSRWMGVEATKVEEKHVNTRQTILTELVNVLYLEEEEATAIGGWMRVLQDFKSAQECLTLT